MVIGTQRNQVTLWVASCALGLLVVSCYMMKVMNIVLAPLVEFTMNVQTPADFESLGYGGLLALACWGVLLVVAALWARLNHVFYAYSKTDVSFEDLAYAMGIALCPLIVLCLVTSFSIVARWPSHSVSYVSHSVVPYSAILPPLKIGLCIGLFIYVYLIKKRSAASYFQASISVVFSSICTIGVLALLYTVISD